MLRLLPRYFAIVPAAGVSRRMGRPKLLLPLDGHSLLAAALNAWRQSRVNHVIVVVRPDDPLLADAAHVAGGEVVIPEIPPPDMKASIQAALRHIEAKYAPANRDAFLVAPADIPRLLPAVIDRLIRQHADASAKILVPTLNNKRGHPVLFPWAMSSQVFELPEAAGLNALVDRAPPALVACDDLATQRDEPFADVDTPEDYQRLVSRKPPV